MLSHEVDQVFGLLSLRPVKWVQPWHAHQVVQKTLLDEDVSGGTALEHVGQTEYATLDAVPMHIIHGKGHTCCR